MATSRHILVLGSLNIDLVQRVERLPQAGETLQGEGLQIFVGGKGANQACAAARLGGSVTMAGRVGNDVFATRLIEELQHSGVNAEQVGAASTASGSATILVLPNGENMIVISPGANATVSPEIAVNAARTLAEGDFLLCQLEIPLESVEAALRDANERGVTTILDPAPACSLPAELLQAVSILTPNQSEASMLIGDSHPVQTTVEAERAAERLRSRGARTIIFKMGEQGSLIAEESRTILSRGFRVKAVDTTAAGDAYNGALAVALAEGETLEAAARFANAAGALSVTKPGAINSLPTRVEVDAFLSEGANSR